jgi:hypothetical protein
MHAGRRVQCIGEQTWFNDTALANPPTCRDRKRRADSFPMPFEVEKRVSKQRFSGVVPHTFRHHLCFSIDVHHTAVADCK